MAVYKERLLKGTGVVLLLAVIVFSLFGYTSTLNVQLQEQVKNTLKSVAVQSVYTLRAEVDNQKNALVEIAERFDDVEVINGQKEVEVLREISQRYPFKRMGIATLDGMVYSTDDTKFSIENRDYFKQAMTGRTVVSERLADYTDGRPIVVFCTPIWVRGEIQGVLFATYSVEELARLLSAATFDRNSTFCIIRENGDVIVDDIHAVEHAGDNVFQRLLGAGEANKTAVAQIRDLIGRGGSGSVEIYHQEKKYLHVSQLGINDWYLLNILSSGVMDETRNRIMNVTYGFCTGVGVLALVFVIFMIGQERRKHQELERILYVDPLTGGYSYQKFLEEARKKLDAVPGKAAYIVMDIEQFKLVNELFGRENGDQVLLYLYRLWKNWIRPNEVFARRIADHFTVLAFYDQEEELIERVEDFIHSIKRDCRTNPSGYVMKPNLGVYLIQDKAEDIQIMQNNAVIAHSSIREENGQFYGVFDQTYKEKAVRKKLLEDQMEQAYQKKEFIVYYQPKYDAQTCAMTGAEALVRWRREDGSLVSPGEFIPLAEKNGFIVKLDKYIFKAVCEQLHEWKNQGLTLVPISVNLSGEHLKDQKFMEEYEEIWLQNDITVDNIELELTESALVENLSAARSVVEILHGKGVRILMDDFGTGYSSLMMLKTLHIDVMKLDKTFVDDYNDPRGEKIIECVINLARSLKFKVTAEGVETREQYEFLKELGCDSIQGYYFARPMPADEFRERLSKG